METLITLVKCAECAHWGGRPAIPDSVSATNTGTTGFMVRPAHIIPSLPLFERQQHDFNCVCSQHPCSLRWVYNTYGTLNKRRALILCAIGISGHSDAGSSKRRRSATSLRNEGCFYTSASQLRNKHLTSRLLFWNKIFCQSTTLKTEGSYQSSTLRNNCLVVCSCIFILKAITENVTMSTVCMAPFG